MRLDSHRRPSAASPCPLHERNSMTQDTGPAHNDSTIDAFSMTPPPSETGVSDLETEMENNVV